MSDLVSRILSSSPMNPTLRRLCGTLAAFTFGGLSTAPLHAQNALYVEHRGGMALVRNVQGTIPQVMENGQLVNATGRKFILRKVDEFLPVFVTIQGFRAQSTANIVSDTGDIINRQATIRATLESAYRLDRVFFGLDMNLESMGKTLLAFEVGRLDPHTPKVISFNLPLIQDVGAGKIEHHIFVDGAEVLQSAIPQATRESALDRMVVSRIDLTKDSAPKPIIGPAPQYPASLVKAKTEGQAIVSFRIDTKGRVVDPVVKSATDPAFGTAALEAVRTWRFLPRVKEGRVIDTNVEMPFKFIPPQEPVAKP